MVFNPLNEIGMVTKDVAVAPDDGGAATLNLGDSRILYAVTQNDEGVDLTVFENGIACTVELSKEMARQLAGLLTVEANDGDDGHG